jgi:hypothetical protein
MKNIRVTIAYRGAEGFVPIGLYELEDERLLGIPSYLLKAGHAKLTDEKLPGAVEEEPSDYDKLQLQIHAGRVEKQDGALVTTKLDPLAPEIGIDPAGSGEDTTVETVIELPEEEAPEPAKKKRR